MSNETSKIVSVKKTALHVYDGSQCETAIYAKADNRTGYRWYVGFGADYYHASKDEVETFINVVASDIDSDLIASYVRKYRN